MRLVLLRCRVSQPAVLAQAGDRAYLQFMSAVRDNPDQHRFEMDIGDAVAVAAYRASPGVLTIYHTEVPSHVEGRGHGTALVRGVLDIMRARGLKVVPRCPFVSAFIARHPEYKDLLA